MNTTALQFFATSPRGLESLLVDELTTMGAQQIRMTNGGVSFAGSLEVCYRVNLESRIATRVLWRVAQGAYQNEEDLYQAAAQLNWGAWFSADHTFMVKLTAIRSPLTSLEFATLRIKDGVCDQFRMQCQKRPSVDTRRPDVRLHAFLTDRYYTFYLDTSGESLFIRGNRQQSVAAPLRENLAAGILRLMGWQPGVALLDPMCGSGTFLLEAAMIALDIAPGLGRRFAFEKLHHYQAPLWQSIRHAALARCKPVQFAHIYGSDIDHKAIAATRQNLEQAGLAAAVSLQQHDFLTLTAPEPQGYSVANPPYGVRVGDEAALAQLYAQLGSTLKRQFANWQMFFITADLRMPKMMHLMPARKTPLFNGALECRLFEFKMVAGSNRKNQHVT